VATSPSRPRPEGGWDVSGFHFGNWSRPDWFKWCGRCLVEGPRHTHLNTRRTDREAKIQVLYTGLPPAEQEGT